MPRTTNNKKSTSRRPTYPAESRVSLSGCILSHYQVARFGISDSHGFARRKAPLLTMHYVYITFQAGRPSGRPLRATSHELRTTKKHWNFPVLFYKNQRLPILPGGLPPSTFGVCGLNCCVRHGNRWIPAAIATELGCSGCSYPDNCIKMFFLNKLSARLRIVVLSVYLFPVSQFSEIRSKRFTQFCASSPTPSKLVLCLSQVLGLLVPVRSVHRCTSTPGLSTTSSLWDLTC